MKRFMILWSTQTLSLFGTFVTQFALNIWLTLSLYPRPEQKPQLALALTALALAATAPLIGAMPLAGATADRHDRRRILILANGIALVFTLGLVVLSAAHLLTLWMAVALVAGYSLAGAFHSAAFDSSYGLLVPQEHLGRASGMMQTSFALSQVLSPAIAATLIGLPALLRSGPASGGGSGGSSDGVAFAFAADALSFAIAIGGVVSVRFASPVRSAAVRPGVWHDVREGVLWIARRRPFVWLISFGSLANLTFAPLMVLLPLLVRDRLAADRARHHLSFEAAFALVSTAMGLGGVAGGVLMTAWGGLKRRRVYGMIGAMVLLGLGQVAAGWARGVAFLAAGLFLSELLVPALNAQSFVLWQELTPPGMLARALATRRFFSQISYPIGAAIAGWLATRFDPATIIMVAGGGLAGWCALQLASPSFSRLEDRLRSSAAEPR